MLVKNCMPFATLVESLDFFVCNDNNYRRNSVWLWKGGATEELNGERSGGNVINAWYYQKVTKIVFIFSKHH